MTRPSQVWRSRLPLFLKMGVGGAAEALANPDGTYDKPLTVTRLMEHRYYDGQLLSERAIRYQLRALEALKVLVVTDPTARVSRYSPRGYTFNVAALANVDLSVAELRPPHRRKGATVAPMPRGQHKGATDAETDAFHGGNQGGNTRGQQDFDPFCTYVLSTKAPPLRVGPVENPQNDDGKTDDGIALMVGGESAATKPPWELFNDARQSKTRNPDVRADSGADSNDADVRMGGRGSDHPAAPDVGLPLQQGPDLPGAGGGDARPVVKPSQPTLGPMDVSVPAPSFAEALAALRAKFAAPVASDSTPRRQRFAERERKTG